MKIEIEILDDLSRFQILNDDWFLLLIKPSEPVPSHKWPAMYGISPMLDSHRVLTVRQLIRLAGNPMPV